MRRILALVASALLAAPALAQSTTAVAAAAKARTAAMVAGDSKGWAKYTTDDFMVAGADGTMKTKQQRMAEIEGHPLSARRDPTDEKWRLYGTTAIHTVLQAGDSTTQRITTVWVKQKGTWKVAAVQVTRVGSATTP